MRVLFFERVELLLGEPIWGTVVMPDGKPADGMKVLAFSMGDGNKFESNSFTSGKTGVGKSREIPRYSTALLIDYLVEPWLVASTRK